MIIHITRFRAYKVREFPGRNNKTGGGGGGVDTGDSREKRKNGRVDRCLQLNNLTHADT